MRPQRLLNLQVYSQRSSKDYKGDPEALMWHHMHPDAYPMVIANKHATSRQHYMAMVNRIGLKDGLRMPFNYLQFDKQGRMPKDMEEMFDVMEELGHGVLLVNMDGHAQRPQSTSVGGATTIEGWRKVFDKVSDFQAQSFERLCDWLDKRPNLKIHGFELINEPDGYDHAAATCEIPKHRALPVFKEIFTRHLLRLIDILEKRGYGHLTVLVPGWKFQGWLDRLDDTPLEAFGGRTPLKVLQDRLGDRIAYGLHFYPDWFGSVETRDEMIGEFNRRLGSVVNEKHRVWTTEINANNFDANDWRNRGREAKKTFEFPRFFDWLAHQDYSTCWWPGPNWARSRPMVITHTGDVRNNYPNSMTALLLLWWLSYPDDTAGSRIAYEAVEVRSSNPTKRVNIEFAPLDVPATLKAEPGAWNGSTAGIRQAS